MIDEYLLLFAEDKDSFKRLYDSMKEEFLKLIEKIADKEKKLGRNLTEEELEAIINDWFKEVDSDG